MTSFEAKRDVSNDFGQKKFYPVSNKDHLGIALIPVAERHTTNFLEVSEHDQTNTAHKRFHAKRNTKDFQVKDFVANVFGQPESIFKISN